MSILTCQIGQCGNQLGQAFYDKMADELTRSDTYHLMSTFGSHFTFKNCNPIINNRPTKNSNTFISNNEIASQKYSDSIPKANSVQIDMEPKVINSQLARKNSLWQYDKDLAYCQQEGSGNNWAYGHYMHGPKCATEMVEKFRSLLEKHDYVEGIMFLQSLAGGTGSGIGSFLMAQLKDEFPELNLYTTVVLPRFSGEVILQFYNCVFSLSTIVQNCDGVFIFDNDSVQRTCMKQYQISRPNLKDMNYYLSQNLASFFFNVKTDQSYRPFEYQTSMLSNNYNKLLGIRNVPQMPENSKGFTADTWNGLSNRLFQMLIGGSNEAEISWNLKPEKHDILRTNGLLLIARGNEMERLDLNAFCNKKLYSKRLAQPNINILKDSHRFDNNDKTLTVVSNTPEFKPILNEISIKAHQMFNNKAFLHNYKKFGLEEDNIKEFQTIFEQIIQSYDDF